MSAAHTQQWVADPRLSWTPTIAARRPAVLDAVTLEDRLAAFKGSEAALLFGSGYLANVGVVSTLAGRGEVVFSDELNHASIIDGCRLAGAQT